MDGGFCRFRFFPLTEICSKIRKTPFSVPEWNERWRLSHSCSTPSKSKMAFKWFPGSSSSGSSGSDSFNSDHVRLISFFLPPAALKWQTRWGSFDVKSSFLRLKLSANGNKFHALKNLALVTKMYPSLNFVIICICGLWVHSTEVAFVLFIKLPRVWFSVFPFGDLGSDIDRKHLEQSKGLWKSNWALSPKPELQKGICGY